MMERLAVVTDAQLRSAVAGLRGLGRGGVTAIALAPSRRAAGLWSRYAVGSAVGPDASRDNDAFLAALNRLADSCRQVVVYPSREETIEVLRTAAGSLRPSVALPFSTGPPLDRLRDKRSLGELAANAGLRTPRVIGCGNRDELRDLGVRTPLIVKPARPATGLGTAHEVRDQIELKQLLERMPHDEPLVVQERLRGHLGAVAVVLDRDGGLVARYQQRALEIWPKRAGQSSLAVSVPPDKPVIEPIVAVLRDVGFWEMAQIQFIAALDGPAVVDFGP